MFRVFARFNPLLSRSCVSCRCNCQGVYDPVNCYSGNLVDLKPLDSYHDTLITTYDSTIDCYRRPEHVSNCWNVVN
jgi:hypothetical protein